MIFAIILWAHPISSLPLNYLSTDFTVQGTNTAATFTFVPATMPTWTVLIGTNGIDTISGLTAIGLTVDSSGMWMVYQASSGSEVTKISTSATALPSTTTATLNLATASSSLPSGKSFPINSGRVYSLCLYPGLGFSTQTSSVTAICGTYHTMGTSSMDRNMGVSSKAVTFTGGSGNSITMTIYSGKYTSNNVDTVNFGVVAHITGSATFNMWVSLGVNDNRMINQDQFLLANAGTLIDGYSNARSSSAVVQDTSNSCQNNANQISTGSSSTSGNMYKYWHGSRLYDTSDPNCDTVITSSTQLCAVYQQGTTVTDLSGDHGSVYCGKIYTPMMMGMVMLLIMSFLI